MTFALLLVNATFILSHQILVLIVIINLLLIYLRLESGFESSVCVEEVLGTLVAIGVIVVCVGEFGDELVGCRAI